MGLCRDKASFVLEVGGRPSTVGDREFEATDFSAGHMHGFCF